MDAFERAQRRAEAARSWLGSSPSADDETEGPTEVVALGFVDLVGSTAWAQTVPLRDQSLALTRFESAAWTSAVLAGGRVIKMIGDEVFFAAPSAEAACRIGARGLPGRRRGRRPAPGPRGRGHRSRHSPGRRLLRAPREPAVPFGQGGAPGEVVVTEAVADELLPEVWVVRPLEPASLRGIDGPCGRSSSIDPAPPTEVPPARRPRRIPTEPGTPSPWAIVNTRHGNC